MIIEKCAIEVGGDRGRNREGRWRKVAFVDVKDSDRVGMDAHVLGDVGVWPSS